MTRLLARLIATLNEPVNHAAGVLLAPAGYMPAWLSNTIVSGVAGVGLLLVYKVSSCQGAIGRTRDSIKANTLALKLYKDSPAVMFRAQGCIVLGAMRLLLLSMPPFLVMLLPVLMLLAQMGLWYGSRPLRVGEEVVVTIRLGGETAWPDVTWQPTDGAASVVGPVRIRSRREVLWRIVGSSPGLHALRFRVAGVDIDKQLAVGKGLMRVSTVRPDLSLPAVLTHPLEKPFADDSPVRSISIDYPAGDVGRAGASGWVVQFFVISMVSALLFRPVFGVRI